jgi:hypothetical protein
VVDLPDASQRWRCAGCGNLTRFDVREHEVEATEVLGESVESVTCRWCGRADAIEVVSRTDTPGDTPR